MKKLAYILLLLVSLAGCKKNSSLFTLEGEIKNFGNGMIFLYGLPGTDRQIDTIFVKEGKFRYSFHPDTVIPLILHIDSQTEYPLLADKGWKLLLEGEASALNRLQIKGTDENEEINHFQLSMYARKGTEKEIALKADSFIRSHPFSPASIYILDKYFVQTSHPDYPRIQTLIKSMSGELQDHPYIKQIDEQTNLQINVSEGKYAPAFTSKDREGKTLASSYFKDQYLLLHFWASWDPQPQQAALLRKINKKYRKEKKFALLGISLDLDRKAWIQAIEKDTLSWKQASDLKGWNSPAVIQYGIRQLPATILIGPDGKIIIRDPDEKEIDSRLQKIFE